MTTRRQLISSDEAVPAKGQHKRPCSDCPFARTSLPGWLGGTPPADWVADAHGDDVIPCHVLSGAQCAGAAIYRRNVCKLPADPAALQLEADRELVFGTPMEFTAHHTSRPQTDGASAPVPPQRSSVMPKSDVIAKNIAIDNLKVKHQKKVDGLVAAHSKNLDRARTSGLKEVTKVAIAAKKSLDKANKITGKVLATVQKVDTVLGDIDAVLASTATPEKKLEKIRALSEKGQKLCDTHLI